MLAVRLYSVAKSVYKRCFDNDLMDAVVDQKLDGDIIIGSVGTSKSVFQFVWPASLSADHSTSLNELVVIHRSYLM
jgi:hypothetical protein